MRAWLRELNAKKKLHACLHVIDKEFVLRNQNPHNVVTQSRCVCVCYVNLYCYMSTGYPFFCVYLVFVMMTSNMILKYCQPNVSRRSGDLMERTADACVIGIRIYIFLCVCALVSIVLIIPIEAL